MKCNDCKFAERNDPESDHGSCQIDLPEIAKAARAAIAKAEGKA